MRTLHTIGSLRGPSPLANQAARRRAVTMGDTETPSTILTDSGGGAFQVPSGAAPGPGTPSYESGVALLNQFDTYGATSEHISDPMVVDFQAKYNAAVGSRGTQLTVDGGYGPSTYAALNWIVGGIAPPVNTGMSPGPSPSPSPAPGPAPLVTPTPATPTVAGEGSSLGFWLALGGAGLAVWYFFFRKKKSKSSGATDRMLVANPRRRAARRRR